jgi:pimeloyl-ACP methyl ester carboxylesterase
VSFANHLKHLVAHREIYQATEQFVDFWSGQGTYAHLNETRRSALNNLIPKVVLDFQAGIYDSLGLEDYRAISTSTCILAGKKSKPVTQRIAISLTKFLPNVRFHWVDGGHMAPISEVEQVNAILVDFVNTLN